MPVCLVLRRDMRGGASAAKLGLVVVCAGVIGATLLSARHLRLRAAHELTMTRVQIIEHDAALWELRSAIGAKVTPEQVEAFAADLGQLKPIVTGLDRASGEGHDQ